MSLGHRRFRKPSLAIPPSPIPTMWVCRLQGSTDLSLTLNRHLKIAGNSPWWIPDLARHFQTLDLSFFSTATGTIMIGTIGRLFLITVNRLVFPGSALDLTTRMKCLSAIDDSVGNQPLIESGQLVFMGASR